MVIIAREFVPVTFTKNAWRSVQGCSIFQPYSLCKHEYPQMETEALSMEISLAGWSINRRFRDKNAPLLLLDYPRVATEEFGINILELNSPFFVYANPDDQATSPIASGYLDELNARASDLGVRMINIAVDGHGDLAGLDEAERKQAVENHKKWIDVCVALGCNAFRANSGGGWREAPTDDKIQQCIKSFGELSELAGQSDIRLMMENHGGVSVSPQNIIRVMHAVDSKYCCVLADFLNWPDEDDKLANLKMVAPYSWAIHAKFLSFGSDGESPEIDCAAALEILKENGYANPYGIEYEGKTDDHEGVLKSKALIEKHAS